jgi:hypothetical protein
MLDRGFTPNCGHVAPDRYQTWRLNLPPGHGTRPRLTWSSTPSGGWLTAEVSLPRFLFGSNIPLVSDPHVQQALAGISRFVSETAGVSFYAPDALVGRVDYCWNFPEGEANMTARIAATAHATVPRLLRHQIGSTTVFFSSKGKRRTKEIRLYGKHEEVLSRVREGTATDEELRASVGLLRLEVGYRNDGCRRLPERYGLPDRLARYLLTGDTAHNELELALEALGLDKTTEPTDARIDVLRELYGDTTHCRCLIAFLGYLDRYGEDFWKHGIGYKRSTYYDYARELKAAGAWLNSDRSLRPLRLVRQAPPARSAHAQGREVRPMSNTISDSPPPPDSLQRLNLVRGRAGS